MDEECDKKLARHLVSLYYRDQSKAEENSFSRLVNFSLNYNNETSGPKLFCKIVQINLLIYKTNSFKAKTSKLRNTT